MDYKLTTKNCRVSDTTRQYLEVHVKKLGRFLEKIVGELPKAEIIIKRQKKRRLNHLIERFIFNHGVSFLTSNPKAPSPIYYELSVKIVLPKKPLFVHSQAKTIEEAIGVCFHRLLKELERYKGKHVSSYSKYLDHRSIRRREKIFSKRRKR